jgi:protocatechuate 3,4-dioxygenase beta subunit
MKAIALLLLLQAMSSCGQSLVGSCEDCEMMLEGMPKTIPSELVLAGISEPGDRLFIQGTVYQADGKTPAPGITVYVYHTDNKGKYSPADGQKDARRHGHLRGWVKSDKDGRYTISTIRPASYPNSRNPQHIHVIILEPSGVYYWIDDFFFDDDLLLSGQERNRTSPRAGYGVIKPKRDAKGVWQGKRDLTLGLNVEGYKAK